MGRQTGVVRIQGSVGNLTFVKTPNGDEVRIKSGPSAEQMRSDKRFRRTRENWAEFSAAGKAAKLIRQALALHFKLVQDRYAYARLVKSTMKVVKSDSVNKRGERVIKLGDFSHLLGFEFNNRQNLSGSFDMPILVDINRESGELLITLPEFNPDRALNPPSGATHVRFVAIGASLNWADGSYANDLAEGAVLPYTQALQPAQTLGIQLPPASEHTILLAFGLWFYQEVNGEYYMMNDGSNNAMALVGINND